VAFLDCLEDLPADAAEAVDADPGRHGDAFLSMQRDECVITL
jgi:hypothetical protein